MIRLRNGELVVVFVLSPASRHTESRRRLFWPRLVVSRRELLLPWPKVTKPCNAYPSDEQIIKALESKPKMITITHGKSDLVLMKQH